MTTTGKIAVLLLLIILILIGFLVFKPKPLVSPIEQPLVTSFEECVAAGYPVMESYPRQCRSEAGELFVENIEKPSPIPTRECFIGGCSAQICSEEKDVASDCMYRPEYACYKTAKCERQVSGQCGWTETPLLQQCLNENRVAAGYIVGRVTIGPNCPVEEEGKPCPTPPEAYSSREVVIYESNGTVIREKGKIDSKGNFNIPIGPGSYFVQIVPAGIGPGEKKPVTVTSFETTTVNFDIDTGIR